jgi:hypothetical protein
MVHSQLMSVSISERYRKQEWEESDTCVSQANVKSIMFWNIFQPKFQHAEQGEQGPRSLAETCSEEIHTRLKNKNMHGLCYS